MADKDILSLTKRIEALEKELNKRQKLFNRSYSTIGTSQSDLLLKTRGAVKIQYGNIFIDLIKNGKIVSDNLITSIDSFSNIPTSKTGIYFTEDDNSVYLAINGQIPINLKGDIGNTYVSFLGEQVTTGEQKHTALTNIGFIYPSIEEAQVSGLSSGIIYVEGDQKLYIILDGQLSEYQFDIPNPYPKQFVIKKSDNSRGALVIEGDGESNGLVVGDIIIYSDGVNRYVNSEFGPLVLQSNGTKCITVTNKITMHKDVLFEQSAVSEMFMSPDATEDSGFRLYLLDGESTLEVDNVIVRNNKVIPKYWSSENNVIREVQEYENPDNPGEIGFQIKLVHENTYQVGDSIYVYLPLENEEEGFYQMIQVPLTVIEGESNYAYVKVESDLLDQEISKENVLKNLIGQITFLVGREGVKSAILRYSKESIDLIDSESFQDEESLDSIHTRIGNLQELNKSINVQQTNSKGTANETITPDVSNNKQGIYSDKLITDKSEQFNANLYASVFKGGPNLNLFPAYEENLFLPTEDDSQIVVTSEWVRRLLKKIVPPGTVVAFSGTEIPEGWALCDGNNGTPNLVDKFIKGGTSNGAIGGSSQIILDVSNLPPHTHSCSSEAHSHQVPIGTATGTDSYNASESASGSISTDSNSHSHTIGSTGGGVPINIEPPYYTLMYIMKLDD